MKYFKIKNENNIPLQHYGKDLMKRQGNVILKDYNSGDGIYIQFDKPLAIHNERFVAKFDREVEGIRIYNVTESYIYEDTN